VAWATIVQEKSLSSGCPLFSRKIAQFRLSPFFLDDKEIDGIRMLITDALETILGRTSGTFLSCVPGLLAYFENEDGRWILKR
jgi:hypothetical protein